MIGKGGNGFEMAIGGMGGNLIRICNNSDRDESSKEHKNVRGQYIFTPHESVSPKMAIGYVYS